MLFSFWTPWSHLKRQETLSRFLVYETSSVTFITSFLFTLYVSFFVQYYSFIVWRPLPSLGFCISALVLSRMPLLGFLNFSAHLKVLRNMYLWQFSNTMPMRNSINTIYRLIRRSVPNCTAWRSIAFVFIIYVRPKRDIADCWMVTPMVMWHWN